MIRHINYSFSASQKSRQILCFTEVSHEQSPAKGHRLVLDKSTYALTSEVSEAACAQNNELMRLAGPLHVVSASFKVIFPRPGHGPGSGFSKVTGPESLVILSTLSKQCRTISRSRSILPSDMFAMCIELENCFATQMKGIPRSGLPKSVEHRVGLREIIRKVRWRKDGCREDNYVRLR
jgi:hypothetical protein